MSPPRKKPLRKKNKLPAAAEAPHRYAATMKASMDGMAIMDHAGKYIDVNDAHARIYGFRRAAEMIGRGSLEFYAPEEQARFEKEVLPTLRKAGQWRGEAIGRRRDGSLFPQEVSLTVVEGGGLACVVRDITQRRQAEEEQKRILELEKQARTEAEAASLAKDEFLAVVSHELRTPMTAILGWTCLLRAGEVTEVDKALDVIERNMKLQAQIIEDLLDVSTIVTGKLQIEKRALDLAAPVEGALEILGHAAQARSIRLSISKQGPLNVIGDRQRLQQVFWNLLSNAIKFNREEGSVRVSLSASEGWAVAVFEDEGEGIPADFLPELFDPLRQAENSLTRRHRGLGIGLSIVRHLVQLHQGEVQAESAGPGLGSKFTVRLPLASDNVRKDAPKASAPVPPLPDASLPHSLDLVNILVVDDEPDTLQVLAELLRYCGAQVVLADSATAGLEAIRRHKPDLIISDISMPGEDGYSFIRKVRALGPKQGGEAPALALTARATADDRVQALEAGFQFYLAKPVDTAKLVAAIRSLPRPASR
jgi:PAS domain S-box-containing protein